MRMVFGFGIFGERGNDDGMVFMHGVALILWWGMGWVDFSGVV